MKSFRRKIMKYNSEICEAIYEQAVEIYKIGGITEARMREYDEMCLANPKPVKKPATVYKKEKVATMQLSPNTL